MRAAAIAAACWLIGCVPPTPGEPDGATTPPIDAESPLADASLDDAAVSDGGGLADAGSDASSSLDAATCGCAEMDCMLAICVGETCDYTLAPDGTSCLAEPARYCLDGACSYDVCGDRYREPGPDPTREACDDGNLDSDDACAADCTPTALVISSEPGQQALPAAVSVAADDAGNLLFVWASTTAASELELRARRYDATGVALGPELPLDPTLGIGWDPHAAVIGLPTGWAVAWTTQDGDSSEAGIRYAIVPTSGLPAASRRANQYELGVQADPAITRTRTGFLVAWADEGGTVTPPGESRLRMRSFDTTGRALTDESPLSPDGTSARELAFASDGDRVLAVWTQDASDPFARPTLVGRRLGGSGPDTSPFTISATDGAEPSAAFLASGDFAVAFVSRAADLRGDIHTRLVRAMGDPLAGTTDATLTSTPSMRPNVAETAPRVLPLEVGYLVTYEDGGDSTATPPRASGVLTVQVGATPLAPEFPTLAAYLQNGLQTDVSLLRTALGSWFAWSDAGSLGVSGAHRSFVAYLLPPP